MFILYRFQKVWRMQNSGEESWPFGCCLQFTSGDQLSTLQRIPVPPLSPSATAEVSVEMKSPSQPGMFQSKWRMITPTGSYFGGTAIIYKRISFVCFLLSYIESYVMSQKIHIKFL